MKVEVVIPCINLWSKYTKNAVDTALDAMMRAKSHGIDAHLLIIDNASTDETRTEGPKLDPHLVYYHRNDERWGFQKSVNFGAAFGFEHGAELIVVCNNDITLHPEAIWQLVQRFQKGDVGMVTCMDVRGEMREKGIVPTAIAKLSTKDKETVEEAPHPNFSAFMFSRECWNVVGEFDEVFFPAYFEDNDYHYRMKLAGVASIVYPPAMFYHFGSRTQNEALGNGQPLVPSPLFENARAFYVKKWGGAPGDEKYETPYNDPEKDLADCKQTVIPN